MPLLNFLLQEGGASRGRLFVAAVLASLASVALLLVVNLAAEEIALRGEDLIDWRLAVGFVVAALVYYAAERDLIAGTCAAMETAIDRVRMRLVDHLRRADYARLERIGSEGLFESITQNTAALSQNAQFVALSVRSVILTLMVLVYIFTVSAFAFVLVAGGSAALAVAFRRFGVRLAARHGEMMRSEQALFATVDDLLRGFREIRLSTSRSAGLAEAFESVSGQTTIMRSAVHDQSFQQLIFGHLAFFFLLALVVFVLPIYVDGFVTDVVKVAAAVIFMIGPLSGVIRAATVLAGAQAAATRMLELDAELAAIAEPGEGLPPGEPPPDAFDKVSIDEIRYGYPAAPGDSPFAVGPLSLDIRRGEILFVTGGNGSGKSTFVKLLTGLYRPDHGRFLVDGVPIDDRNRRAWREKVAAVFADQRLPHRLHGLAHVDPDEVRELLGWVEMERIVGFDGDAFSRIALSSGQRKRLLLVAALLEHRPLLVLDEWAADQDPLFRRKFYREILPALRDRGLTIVAVTHDDHYFDVADRRVHFEDGRVAAQFDSPAGMGH